MRLYIGSGKRSTGSVCSDRDQPRSSIPHLLPMQTQLISAMCTGQRHACRAVNSTFSGLNTQSVPMPPLMSGGSRLTQSACQNEHLLGRGCGRCHTAHPNARPGARGFGGRRGQSSHSRQSLLDKQYQANHPLRFGTSTKSPGVDRHHAQRRHCSF